MLINLKKGSMMRTKEFVFAPSYLADVIGKNPLDFNAVNTIIYNNYLDRPVVPFDVKEAIKGRENLYINIAFHTSIICRELDIPFNSSSVWCNKPQFSSSHYNDMYDNIESSLLTKPEFTLANQGNTKLNELYENIVTLSDMHIVYVNEGFLYKMSHNKEEAKKFFLDCLRLLYNEKNFNLTFRKLLTRSIS
jgi:hypothetical protein